MSLIKNIFPSKTDSGFELVRKTLFFAAVFTAAVCLVVIFGNMNRNTANQAVFNNIADIVERAEFGGTIAIAPETAREIRDTAPGIQDKYIELYSLNSDMVGWLTIPNEDGSSAMGPVGTDGVRRGYPVLQYRRELSDGRTAGSNFYYLEKDFYHNYSEVGSIYAEWRFPITAESRPDNTIIYGHNVGDGSMFAPVSHYFPYRHSPASLDFYKAHPIIQFDNLYEPGLYKVFAAIYVHVDEDKFDDVFDYHRRREFPDKASFYGFIQDVLDRSGFYNPDVDLKYGDEILTLSTCYYAPLGRNVETRVAVFARRVRDGEDATVDTEQAYINPDPLYFEHYYKVMGGAWGGRKWDLRFVEGLEEQLAINN
ncbi:MAG: class B sortase [Oscillospiraceae bacterium]|nr:class B sortase [Oscillospiraceae bacterium]